MRLNEDIRLSSHGQLKLVRGATFLESMGVNSNIVGINTGPETKISSQNQAPEFPSCHPHDLQKCGFLVVHKFTVPNMKYE
jgi:hypothetical protein